MLEELKERVCNANRALYTSGIVIYTWGNVSEFDEKTGYVVIKPSGVAYDKMTPCDMVVVDLNGKVVDGNLKPSSDTPTHLEIYRNFSNIKSICHTHSIFATAYAQAGIAICPYGTTHADYFSGEIPITRELTKEEIARDYELNTGKVIVETMKREISGSLAAILVKSHGPFTFGSSAEEAVYHAVILETVAKMSYLSKTLNPTLSGIPAHLLDKHYLRKHGPTSYYGQ